MKEIDPKVLGKIKKCLALAGSDNPNEAATAMRQAHALMEKHGVSHEEITMSDIGEANVTSKTMARNKPAHWEARLASLVGRAFGCQMMVQRMVPKKDKGTINEGSYIYVGLKHQAELASYTATVLIAKCKRARQKWVKELSDHLHSANARKSRADITRMGDAFAEGWVNRIYGLVMAFANPDGVDAAIAAHIEKRATQGPAAVREIPEEKIDLAARMAASAGASAAEGEQIHRPMRTRDEQLALPVGVDGLDSKG